MDDGRDGREGHSVSASTTPPQPVTPSDSEVLDANGSDGDWDPRDEAIDNCRRELQQLKNRLAAKDQEISEYQLEAQRHKLIKKESNKVAGELHKALSSLAEEKERLKESRAQSEQYRIQAEQYKAQVEQLQRAAADASATCAAATADLKEVKSREVELEAELQKSRATVQDLRSRLEALQKSQELEAQSQAAAAQAEAAQAQNQSPTLGSSGGASPASPNGSASGRPAKNLDMVPATGSVDLVADTVTRFTEMPTSSGAGPMPSKLREMPKGGGKTMLFTNGECAHQETVEKVHLPGYGITDGASTLAKVLLSRIQISVYSPGYRRQQQQYQQQIGMQMQQQMMAQNAQNGMQQMQVNHIVQVPVQPVGLPAGGHMHGMNLPTQG